MYKWLKAYIEQFGADFPLSAVIDHTEYEIVRILQECCETNTPYTPGGGGETPPDADKAAVGKAKVGEATI